MNKLYVWVITLAVFMFASPIFAGQASPQAPQKIELKEEAKANKKATKAKRKALRKEIRKAIFGKKDKKDSKFEPSLRTAILAFLIGLGFVVAAAILALVPILSGLLYTFGSILILISFIIAALWLLDNV